MPRKKKSPAWTRKEGKNPKGGLNAKGRASYNRATGGNLKPPAPKPKRQASTPVAAIEGRGSAKAVDADDDAVPSPSAQRRKDRMGKRRFRVGLDVNVANVGGSGKTGINIPESS